MSSASHAEASTVAGEVENTQFHKEMAAIARNRLTSFRARLSQRLEKDPMESPFWRERIGELAGVLDAMDGGNEEAPLRALVAMFELVLREYETSVFGRPGELETATVDAGDDSDAYEADTEDAGDAVEDEEVDSAASSTEDEVAYSYSNADFNYYNSSEESESDDTDTEALATPRESSFFEAQAVDTADRLEGVLEMLANLGLDRDELEQVDGVP